jgi:signal transduction histidine kinase
MSPRSGACGGLINDITRMKKAGGSARQLSSRPTRWHARHPSVRQRMRSTTRNFILLNARLFARVWADVLPVLDEYQAHNGDFSVAGMPYSGTRDKLVQSLHNLVQGSERIQNITKSLTEYARRDGGARTESVDLNKVVAMAITMTDTLIQRSTTNFRVDYGAHLPLTTGNIQQLEQVIINLITNACQSLPDTSGEIRIKTYSYGKARGGGDREGRWKWHQGVRPEVHHGSVLYYQARQRGNRTGPFGVVQYREESWWIARADERAQ